MYVVVTLMMHIRNDFPQTRREDLEVDCEEGGRIESMVIEARLKCEKWVFISVYKQPKVGNK